MRTQHHHALKALVVDDDNLFGSMLSNSLLRENYEVSVIGNYRHANAFIDECIAGTVSADEPACTTPDVIILDYFLDEGKTGLELCRKIRSRSDVPIIMLTGNTSVETTVACLESGADQYIHKPCQMPELLARIKVCTRNRRKPGVTGARQIEAAGVSLLLDERYLVSPRNRIELTEKECVLAEILLQNINQPVSKEALREHVYGNANNIHSRNLDVLVGRLRKKLQPFGGKFRIYSMRNIGYKLVPMNHVA